MAAKKESPRHVETSETAPEAISPAEFHVRKRWWNWKLIFNGMFSSTALETL